MGGHLRLWTNDGLPLDPVTFLATCRRILVVAIAFAALGASVADARRSGPKRSSAKVAGAKVPRAKQAGKGFAVLASDGADPKNAPAGAKIAQALKKHKIQVITGVRVQNMVRKAGPPRSDDDWAKLARKLKVDGFVAFTLSQEGGKRIADVAIRNGADGAVAGQETFTAEGPPKRLVAVLGGSLWNKLGRIIQQSAGPKQDGESTGLPVADLSPPEKGETKAPRTEGGSPGEAKSPKPSAGPEREQKVVLAGKGEGEGPRGKG